MRAVSGRNHRGDPPRTILGRFALFTWPGIYGDAVFEGLVTTPRHRHTPVPVPPLIPTPGETRKALGSEVYGINASPLVSWSRRTDQKAS